MKTEHALNGGKVRALLFDFGGTLASISNALRKSSRAPTANSMRSSWSMRSMPGAPRLIII
jgi:hypothetical protein